MKELDDYTCRARLVLTKQLQLLWRTAMVIAAVFLLMPGAFAQSTPPALPDPARCVAQDLLATEARLIGDSPCYTCEEGNALLSTLQLTINNKTGSVRTSVAFWATLEITNSEGQVTESYINGCTGPLSGKDFESFGFGEVEYTCGDALKLKNIYLAWTDASENASRQCPLDPAGIAPKCRAQGDLVIIPPLSARVETFEKPCVGESNGSIEIFAQGGTGTYTYTLNPGNISNNTGVFTSLAAGNYTIDIVDAESCATEVQFVLEEQVCCVPPTITAQPGDESVCEGEAASFTVEFTGGDPAPTIKWQVSTDGTNWDYLVDGGAISGATTTTLSISATTVAMDGNMYRAELTSGTCDAVYSDPADLEVNEIPDAPVVQNDEFCVSAGTVTLADYITAEGTVLFTDAGGVVLDVQPTTLSRETAGVFTYYVIQVIKDCRSEIADFTITINENPAAPVVENDEFCVSTGSVTLADYITAEGTVLFTDAGGVVLDVQPTTLSRETAGVFTYYVIQVDGDCRSEMADFTITINENPATPTATVIHPTCVSKGSITVTGPIGEGLEYSIDDGNTWQSELVFAGLDPGTYTVLVKNTSDCMAESDEIIVDPVPGAPAAPILAVVQPTCTEESATITVTSATADLMFSFNGGDFAAYPVGGWVVTIAGEYTVIARNTAMCESATARITVNPMPETPAAPVLGVVNPTCTVATGTLLITSETEGLMFSVNEGAYAAYPAEGWSGLTPGVYKVTAKNEAGCISSIAEITISEQPATPVAPRLTVMQPTCDRAGSITVTGPIGEGLEYSINDGDTWQSGLVFGNLDPGTYTVWVRNGAGCMAESAEKIVNPIPDAPTAPVVRVTQPTCLSASATIVITSATADLMFSFNGGDFAVYPVDGWVVSVAGEYSIVAKNRAMCISGATRVMVNPQPRTPAAPTARAEHPTCSTSTGTITVTAPLGEGIMYSLNDGTYQSSTTFSNLAPGNYTLTSKNAAGCESGSTSVRINSAPNVPSAPTATVTQPTCLMPMGMITITSPTGAGLMYSLNGGAYQANATFSDLMPGTYSLRVRNEAGCISAATTIVVNDQPKAPAPIVKCETSGFSYEEHKKGLFSVMHTSYGPVGVTARKRNPDGTYAFGNYAALFDTQAPTGDDTDLYTTDWGLAAIINQDQTNVPNDNQWGGEMIFNFAAVGPVTMQSLKALDIDAYENMSWVYLYDAAGKELYKVQLKNLGDNSKQDVDLGNTKGVMTMKVVMDGRNDMNQLSGSGAIDEIRFCVEETASDCSTNGFTYKDHKAGLITMFKTPYGHVNVTGRKRNANGTFAAGNHAALFDTQNPTGDDTDLATMDWGLALIINQDQTNVPNDNQWGGEMILDFSEFGPVTMQSLKALDIDAYENMSWIYLYDAAGKELYKVQLKNLGDNSRQDVDLGNTKGVMTMKVVLDGRTGTNQLSGSGAIDEIRFCIERSNPCVDEQTVEKVDVIETSISDVTAYPTPFQDRTTIQFRVRKAENYVVNLYDTKGMLIKQLKTGTAIAGELNTVEVDGRDLSDGMYLARIATGSGSKTVKLILKK